jgi:ATP synthase protein I
MDEEHGTTGPNKEPNFIREVGAQAARKLKAARRAKKSVWFGLGMSGLIGWSVTIPTLIGAALGRWLDNRYPSQYSWTLMLLLVGLIIGCFNAWYWVDSQYKAMREDPDE